MAQPFSLALRHSSFQSLRRGVRLMNIFTQRTIHVVLRIKTPILSRERPNLAGNLGEQIRTARQTDGMTRDELSKTTGIPVDWLGRWERDRSRPIAAEWQMVKNFLANQNNCGNKTTITGAPALPDIAQFLPVR
ncbi:MAG TPA: helix-turn-helix transcriptional regulator [Verrucomicrobiae bacterium]|nr:helix-turn-helix transcriptional regulator [Verrucomicrobiae bacterium]